MDDSWREKARCLQLVRSGELTPIEVDRIFFPRRDQEVEGGRNGGRFSWAMTQQAKKICNSCFVRKDCLEYALVTSEKNGIWGGATESERRKMRRERRLGTLKQAAVG